ncbi:hypothetical protein [Flavobacterium sp. J27]|uniref:hypothetical protein n=1 Tax=Flavobacterium sp. J27 TaxID=2060419 RepID=UPI00103207D7|nr:hypothetical protein [Flavobacterium sp. J27]
MAKKKIVLLLVFIFSILEIKAQPGFGDDVDDVGPAAPIDNHLILAIGGAIGLGYVLIKQINKHKKI